MSAAESGAEPDRTEPDAPAVQRGSGDAALAGAIERGVSTAGLNLPDAPPVPTVPDTANLRLGAPLHDAHLELLPLVGVWRGEGELVDPITREVTPFGQQITMAHDGRTFLRYESLTWKLDAGSTPLDRELGWWRPQHDGRIELLIARADGVVEVFYGRATALTVWNLSTDAVIRTMTAPDIVGATRLYGVVEGKLAYVEEQAGDGYELQPRISALLDRVIG